MLLVTVRSILTGPNKLTVLLHYINVFQPKLQWQCKANIWEELPILGITLPAKCIYARNLLLLAMFSTVACFYLSIIPKKTESK